MTWLLLTLCLQLWCNCEIGGGKCPTPKLHQVLKGWHRWKLKNLQQLCRLLLLGWIESCKYVQLFPNHISPTASIQKLSASDSEQCRSSLEITGEEIDPAKRWSRRFPELTTESLKAETVLLLLGGSGEVAFWDGRSSWYLICLMAIAHSAADASFLSKGIICH